MMTIVIEIWLHVLNWHNPFCALAERMGRGEVGGCHPDGDSAWHLLQLAIVNARWAIVLLSCTNRPGKHSFCLVEAPFLTF